MANLKAKTEPLDLIGASEAARILGVSTQTVRNLALTGRLSFTQTGVGKVFRRADVERLAAERRGE